METLKESTEPVSPTKTRSLELVEGETNETYSECQTAVPSESVPFTLDAAEYPLDFAA